jgi:ubiquinone/menaquinone biosynthesis C-methylase UbiE
MMTSVVSRQVQVAYDQIVEAYASRNHAALADNLIAPAEALVRRVGPGGCILEIGCGTGRDMAWFEAHGLLVTGIDLSWGMLSYARHVTMGDLLQMDMTRLALADARFDGAWCCASLLHLPKEIAPRALQEIYRVLKSGAMLVLSIQGGDGEVWEESYVPGVQRFFARYQPSEISELVSQSGFSIHQITDSQSGSRRWLTLVCLRTGSSPSSSIIETGAQ